MTSLGRGAAMQCDLIHPFFVHAFSMEKPSAMAPPVHNGTIERLGSAGPCERDMTTNESTKQQKADRISPWISPPRCRPRFAVHVRLNNETMRPSCDQLDLDLHVDLL